MVISGTQWLVGGCQILFLLIYEYLNLTVKLFSQNSINH